MENYQIRQLKESDTNSFIELIVDIYSNLDDLEWFGKMPIDHKNIINIIKSDRFFILGAFLEGKLASISSFDYKCGKILDKINFENKIRNSKIAEIGFTLTHSDYRKKGLMKLLVNELLKKAKRDNFNYVFAKIHKENIASLRGCLNSGFKIHSTLKKEIKKEDFAFLIEKDFIKDSTKSKAVLTLKKFENEEKILVDYNILIKEIK